MAYVTRTMKSAHSIIACSSRTVLFKKEHSLIRSSRGLPLSTLPSSVNDTVTKQPIKTMSDLPGPVSLPVIGTIWTFFVGARSEPLGKRILPMQGEQVKKYGRIFRIQLPGVTIVALADPADVAKVLRAETKYPKRFQFPILDYYREKRQKIPGVFFAEGPEWYKHRSVLSKRMLRPKEVADYASGFNEIITDFIHRLRTVREPSGSEKENEVGELDSELFKWSFESVAEMLFDKRFGCLEPEVNKEAQTFIKAVGDFLSNAIGVGFLPNWFYKIYETQQFKKFFDNFDTMYECAELFIGRRINELEEQQKVQSHHSSKAAEGDKAGFFEFLLSSGKLTKDDLLASVIDVLFAGVDTTSNTMQWMLYMMAKNPDKQDILRHEVLSVLGDRTLATPTTLAQMPYLKAWVRETLRLYPVLSTIPRIPAEDLILSGYLIPGGTTQVDFFTYYMGRDEKVFEDAEAFKPERWLRKKDVTLTEAVEAFSSIPFGFGTRMCLGRRIAELELHLLLARIVQQFEISYPPDAEEVEPFMRGVTIPDRALRVQFGDRQSVKN
ncbi:hypothetical protein OS493_002771 [Desmophyllum pertusum]|uniref:Cholesterol side-chain cleavage enzyme, mitochondrial n=1 Tax=Desmophyllum pertusum TaxID=174260 RepID=A0A9W9YHH7_9CNID|nr:hypothetical protein OS493_002771 [Desmophyllum pertusum]